MRHFRTIRLKKMTHVVLFLLISAQNPDFLDITIEKTTQHGIAETASASSDEENFIFKYAHISIV